MDRGTFNIADFYKTVANHIFISDGPMSNIFVKHFWTEFCDYWRNSREIVAAGATGRSQWLVGGGVENVQFLKKDTCPMYTEWKAQTVASVWLCFDFALLNV